MLLGCFPSEGRTISPPVGPAGGGGRSNHIHRGQDGGMAPVAVLSQQGRIDGVETGGGDDGARLALKLPLRGHRKVDALGRAGLGAAVADRKSTRLNSRTD